MTPKADSVFLDTSVIISAVLSETGGARQLFRLGEIGVLQLVVGPNVLRESEEVVRRKAPASLEKLAFLLNVGKVETSVAPSGELVQQARLFVEYRPDAYVLAEALQSNAGWLVTHDKKHFFADGITFDLPLQIGTPGDLLQAFQARYS